MDWKRILRELFDARVTQVEIAAECGVSQASVSELSRGRQSPGFDFGVRLVAMHARICRGGASGVIPVPAQTTVRVEPSGFAPLDGIA